jgi:hypothetical protein
MIDFGVSANENTPIVAAALDIKVRRAACPRVFSNRVIPARRRKTHLKTQLTALPLRRIRLPGRVGKAGGKLLIIFGAQAVGNKHNHARHAFGAFVDGGLATPAKQNPVPFNKETAAIIQLDARQATSAFGGIVELASKLIIFASRVAAMLFDKRPIASKRIRLACRFYIILI